ncbi:hypothetical protein [Roseateles asaccharophilus]|uniref:Uncharacterized protein n=1 Tax=Roseateles asaccharophilus TaxID=582607 RepID=A0ABU2AA84_9BURK|nr:hypothetical protein [Roseateles asaccharophilus]MDR7333493.1 hypothetical protein [Roseateles asaccharophilus]
MLNNKKLIKLGRFLISPMVQERCDGGFDALVSIRSGRGTASVDRIMRFSPKFSRTDAALRYATTQGVAWVRCQ